MPQSTEDKILSLKARRAQLQSKLDEWEVTHVALTGKPSTSADRSRSREHRELSKLLVDLDGFVASLEGGTSGGPLPHAPGTQDAERRAERGRVKAKMRRWEKNFEKTHKRKPTAAEIEASEEMQGLQAQLRGDSPQPQSRSDSPQPPLQRVDSGGQQQQQQQTPQQQTAVANESGTPDANWIRGNDYHEILRARVRSQASVNGFAGVSQSEAHTAAESFAAWDLDRDGVLSKDEFITVLQSLAEGKEQGTLDDATLNRLFALVDRDNSGDIDFNEWLAVYSQLGATTAAVSAT